MENKFCSCKDTCCYFSNPFEINPIEQKVYMKDRCWEETIREGEIIFVLQGSFLITYERLSEQIVEAGKMLLLFPGCIYKARTGEGVFLLKFRLIETTRFCEQFSLEKLTEKVILSFSHLPVLNTPPVMNNFLSNLIDVLQSGLQCQKHMELKIKELFYLFKVYYTKEELLFFFYPLFSKDASFSEFILKNYRQVRTVNEFATLYSCSVSNFDKKFKRTFGMPAYKWMIKKKVDLVFYQIRTTNKAFKQIAEETGFLSLPQFTDFCKKHLGDAPGKIRKYGISEIKE